MITNNDPEGKETFKEWLIKRDFKDVNIVADELCHYDIISQKNGVKYIFELKKRPINSDQWGDSIIQEDKYNFLLPLDNEYSKVYIVNLFKDCMYIVPLQYEHENQRRYCQLTNNWCRKKVLKTLVSYKHINKHKYEYDNDLC